MRRIGVVSVARSDYGIYRPVLRRLHDDPELELRLLVGGMHLVERCGLTVREIEADGYPIAARVEAAAVGDDPGAIAAAMARGTVGFAQALERERPDLLLVLGDRYEMHAAVVAALPFAIPVAHVHGGESTEGVIDEAIRHSITKMSHLHFPSTEVYARRLVRMGEEPWRVTVSGAPSLDNLAEVEQLDRAALAARHGIEARDPFLLVTYHPVTLDHLRTGEHVDELLAALAELGLDVVFTAPNADTSNGLVARRIDDFVARTPGAQLVASLGTAGYFALMRHAAVMVGNSSSGIIEAPSFGLPVVNVGERQRGRLRAANVIDVPDERAAIGAAVRAALEPGLRERLAAEANPYGDGQAAARIVERLRTVPLDAKLLRKSFYDGDGACA